VITSEGFVDADHVAPPSTDVQTWISEAGVVEK
jgi:hypothetical protein